MLNSPRALLIVHGIGEQRRGETTAKLLVGLKRAYGDAVQVQHDANGFAESVTANNQTVRLYEVYWADILSAEKSRGTFTWRIFNTVVWHPLWCRRLGLFSTIEYPGRLVWWRVLTLVPLVPAGYLAYLGVRFISTLFDKSRRQAFEKKMQEQNLPLLERSKAYANFTSTDPTGVDEMLDSVVADVPNYMQSIVAGEGPAFEILKCFHSQMERARLDGCEVVHVLAHSLGTVVAFHALSGLGLTDGEPRPAPSRLFTIGSPLEKIRFFWPWTVRMEAPVDPDFRWVNFHHRADRVSGSLKRFASTFALQNVRLTGGGGLLRSHVVYERSPEFLSVLTTTLFGAPAAPDVNRFDRAKDRVLAWGENLLGPVALIVAIVIGLAFVALVVLLPAYLVAWPFRLAGADAIGQRVQTGVAWFTLFGFTTAMLAHAWERCKDARTVCERACDRSR